MGNWQSLLATVSIGDFFLGQAWHWVLLALLLACSAFFSAAETSLFSLSRGELYRLGHEKGRLSRLVPSLMRDPGQVLAAVLLGNNAVNILYFISSTLLVVQAERNLPHGQVWGVLLAIATLLALIIVGEVVPKSAAFLYARRFSPLAAPVLLVIVRIIHPIQRVLMVVLIEPLTRLLAPRRGRRADLSTDELAALLALSQRRGLIGQDESELLQEVLELTDLRAGDIMVPRVDLVAYPAGGSNAGLLALVRQKRLSKVPVYEKDLDHIVGVLHVKRWLCQPESPFRQALEAVQYVPETAALERVLLQFRATGSQIAVVVDEYGGTAGMITLEEVLEEIVGDIADAREGQRGPAVQRLAPAEWLVDGDLPIHEWAEAFPSDLKAARFSTVGGFVISLLGQVPTVGQTVGYRNVKFTVEAMRQRRVALLRVQLTPDKSETKA